MLQVDIEKPLGLNFKESKAAGGGLVVTVRLFSRCRSPG